MDINTLITQNFNNNIEYIQHYHPELFSKLAAFDNAVENGQYAEKYELLYENKNFDVLEKSTGTYLYNKESQKHSDLSVKSIERTPQYDTFKLLDDYQPITNEKIKEYASYTNFEHQMSGFAPIISYIQNNISKSTSLNALKKYIFFGTGLGLHISSINEKIQANVYFIVEDDLELFRLSLFTTNYVSLSHNAALFFSVFEDKNEFKKKAEAFLVYQYAHNNYIKFFQMLHHSDTKQKEFHIVISSESHKLFFYNSLLTQYLKPLEYIFDGYQFIEKKLHLNDPILNSKNFLILAAGPSLQKNLQWLKQHQHSFVLVALSATLSILEKEGIVPDIITHLDAFDTATVHFTKLTSVEFIQNALCLFSARTSHTIISLFAKENIFLFENGTGYMASSLKPSAPCIGSLTYQLMLLFQAKNIYLLGLDLSVDSTTGKTHSDEHAYVKVLDLSPQESSLLTYKESIIYVDGNFQKNVPTTPHFKTSIDTINHSAFLLQKEFQRIYNLSEGAKFENTLSLDINNLPLNDVLDKNEIDRHLHQVFNENSTSFLTESEQNDLALKIRHAIEIKESVDGLLLLSSLSAEDFIHEIEKLAIKISDKRNLVLFEINRIIDAYLRYILPYINDFFNHDIINEIEHTDSLKLLLCGHLFEILDYTIDHLQKYNSQSDTKES